MGDQETDQRCDLSSGAGMESSKQKVTSNVVLLLKKSQMKGIRMKTHSVLIDLSTGRLCLSPCTRLATLSVHTSSYLPWV